ncbi:SRPBCC family protein [Psychroserpens sp.]|uniref:SRPBCC family protein n=1 Tax=Psychroserpens sp. TaxID=2020870 RepID=UPI001B0687E9|nr:SRPBCC family protein [Psychroserpens sp.]MBO6607606.1 SRPBCC family protein [Psychroserpens sp.]MBO6631052.1 SRPBCC family protein [Psychroserpens sp.]MBO6655082.1 SRPBCC family protein [Psychroserpens sp.]MBO6683113.1 SRPBCC family protein [Psychroserpens sp.]MBO6749708.1 SRPBCC family protein [Psychroserpens sp.]
MKALKYIFFLLLIFIIGFAIYIAVQPNDFSFERHKVINAPAEVVYQTVNEFKEWPRFSPWLEQDTLAKITYGERTSGSQANYSWNGDILGVGSMTTLQTVENASIDQRIDFVEPFETSSNVNWSFEPQANGTKVTWSMSGEQDFMTKMYVAFKGTIEENTGPNFERGLFKLDSIVQSDMKQFSVDVEGITQHSGGFYLYNTTSCRMSDFKEKMQEMMPRIGGYAISNNIKMAGVPFVIYHKWDEANDAVIFSCCIPTSSKMTSTEPDILTGQLEPFKTVKTVLTGDYENLKTAWEETMTYIEENNLVLIDAGPKIEMYLTDPISTPNPAQWKTEIYLAVE